MKLGGCRASSRTPEAVISPLICRVYVDLIDRVTTFNILFCRLPLCLSFRGAEYAEGIEELKRVLEGIPGQGHSPPTKIPIKVRSPLLVSSYLSVLCGMGGVYFAMDCVLRGEGLRTGRKRRA